MDHKRIKLKKIASHLAGLGAISVLGAQPALAGETEELKAMLKEMQAKMSQLQDRLAQVEQAKPSAAPVAASPAAGKPITLPSGLELNIYGRGDIGYTTSYAKNSAGKEITNHRFNQGEMASRLGLSGAWNFDPELKAIFGVETGLNLFNGNAGGGVQNYNNVTGTTNSSVLFNRGATVGLASTKYGSVEGGLMYMAPFWVALGADQASAHNYGANDFSALFSVTRPESLGKYLKDSPMSGATNGANSGTALFYSNAVRYRTIKFFDAVTSEVSYSNGQQVANSTGPNKNDGRTVAFNVQYNKNGLYMGYAHMNYMQVAQDGSGSWQTRDQLTDIVGARYDWKDFQLGGAYVNFRATNSGGYKAQAFGLSGAYKLSEKHRFEASVGRVSYDNATSTGVYGANTALANAGEPRSTAYSVGYLYNLKRNLSAYAYYTKMQNNAAAKLGTLQFRSDTNYPGFSPAEWTVGMYYVF